MNRIEFQLKSMRRVVVAASAAMTNIIVKKGENSLKLDIYIKRTVNQCTSDRQTNALQSNQNEFLIKK